MYSIHIKSYPLQYILVLSPTYEYVISVYHTENIQQVQPQTSLSERLRHDLNLFGALERKASINGPSNGKNIP